MHNTSAPLQQKTRLWLPPLLPAESRKQVSIGQEEITKMSFCLTRCDFCCEIQMVGSECGIDNMTASTQPYINSPGYCLWCNGVRDTLSTINYLIIAADHVHLTTVNPSSHGNRGVNKLWVRSTETHDFFGPRPPSIV